MVTSSQRLPLTTYLGHTDRALGFYESDSVYFALGRTSKWDGEDEEGFVPPSPEMDATTLDELVCLKKTSQKLLVYPSDDGEIEFDGQYWKIITAEQAKELQSRWVYITTTIRYNEIDLTEYRQVGIYNRVKPLVDVNETESVLTPDKIEDLGLLIGINNRYRVTRQTDTRDTYSLIIEF